MKVVKYSIRLAIFCQHITWVFLMLYNVIPGALGALRAPCWLNQGVQHVAQAPRALDL